MTIISDIIKISNDGKAYYAGWVEYEHHFIPNKPEWFREIMRNIMAKISHCMECTALDGCFFQDKNRPQLPIHNHCDCNKRAVSFNIVKAYASSECAIEKFTKYVFRNDKESKGKNKIFYDLGYTIDDAEYLQAEYCKQALNQYLLGKYKLKNLDKRGQRLAISIELNGVRFYSGWMLYPEGKIKNTTPFGGWIK